MSNDSPFFHEMDEYFRYLRRQLENEHMSLDDVLNRVPQYVSHLLFSTPGRLGQSLEYFVSYATNDAVALMRTARALASATLALATRLDEQGASTAAVQDLEYHWTQLNALVLHGVLPGKEEHGYYWIRFLVREEGLEAAVIDALTHGAAHLSQRQEQSGWPHDSWEWTVPTEQIVEWLQLRYEAERRRQAARDWQLGGDS